MWVHSATLASFDDVQALESMRASHPQLVWVFGDASWLSNADGVARLAQLLAPARLIGCSTAGEITARGMEEGTLHLTAVRFEHTPLVWAQTLATDMDDSQAAGERVGRALQRPDLAAVLVFGPGVAFNGSALVRGMQQVLGPEVPISGGLAADGGAFQQTWVVGGGETGDRAVVAVGFCGDRVRVGHGSYGGWEPFGPARCVTRSAGNVLYELDGEPALAVYKRYLGPYAKDLPASGLLFPFSMEGDGAGRAPLIRTILGVSEADGSLTLAGEIEQGGHLRLMQAATDQLVDGAEEAARQAGPSLEGTGATLALLVSCVGRKLVMGDRVDEELDAVAAVLGQGAVLTGFYSNGEISPGAVVGDCHLHNQTMTVTTLSEV